MMTTVAHNPRFLTSVQHEQTLCTWLPVRYALGLRATRARLLRKRRHPLVLGTRPAARPIGPTWDREVAASRRGDTPYSGEPVISGSVTPYTTSVYVNLGTLADTRSCRSP